MPDDTPILGLPMILPAQAQKHVTHNEALRLLDILVHLTVRDRDLAAPPALPAEGDRYIVAANPTGAWAGQAGRIAPFWGGIWVFIAPREGWTARILDEAALVTLTNGLWTRSDLPPETVARLGIGTAADATNRLSVVSPATLFSHAGGSHRMVLNKAAAGDTASIVMQSGFSGRAEIGLTGTNALSVRVSGNGTDFVTALAADAAGNVTLPQGLGVTGDASFAGAVSMGGAVTLNGAVTLAGPVGGGAVQASASDGTAGRLLTVGAFGLGAGSAPLLANLDATATLAGDWRTADTATAGTWPPGATTAALRAGVLTVQRPDAATILHRWLQSDTATEWTRRNLGAGWSAWARAVPVTGTVAMTAGLPTGAVIQRGTGAQGEFVRFADGTQICTVTITLGIPNQAIGSMFQAATATVWTFPAAFSALPVVSGLTASTSAWLSAAAPTVTNISLRGMSAASLGTALPAYVMAVGRWV